MCYVVGSCWLSINELIVTKESTCNVGDLTWVRFLGWEDPLEEGMATHSSILAWRIPMDREALWATVHGSHQKLDMTE